MKCVMALAALLAACASVPVHPMPLEGDWGGPHVGLHLTRAGGTLDYDCAHGTIGPLLLGEGGHFIAQGTHTPEHGGPAREGEVLPALRVRYDGIVRHDRMMLRGKVETGVLLGPFDLRRGAEPRIFRCL